MTNMFSNCIIYSFGWLILSYSKKEKFFVDEPNLVSHYWINQNSPSPTSFPKPPITHVHINTQTFVKTNRQIDRSGIPTG